MIIHTVRPSFLPANDSYEYAQLATGTWDSGTHQQPESLRRATPGPENADISGRKWPETCPEKRMGRYSQVRRSERERVRITNSSCVLHYLLA
jgi:hypothetical protein